LFDQERGSLEDLVEYEVDEPRIFADRLSVGKAVDPPYRLPRGDLPILPQEVLSLINALELIIDAKELPPRRSL
jgi:hypothetical protein